MSFSGHLRLDGIITSFPELGPTVPDGGYAWVVLCGVLLIQMTISSILPMYGVVLAYLHESKASNFDLWNEKIILTPVLFTAFWNLADPWSKIIVSMASMPRLVGIIGIILLTVGIIASGYLATGGVGAYLASTSAGAVMGIGASFVILLSDYVLRKNFRKKLPIALTLRNIGTSFGLMLTPCFTNLLFIEFTVKTGLQLMAILLLPAALGILTLQYPPLQQTTPYSLLLSTEEDTELPVRISSDDPKDLQHPNVLNNVTNQQYEQADERICGGGLLSEGSNMYAYEELDEDVDLFINPVTHVNNESKYRIRAFKYVRFWYATIAWVGVKVSTLFFWILLPILSYEIINNYFWMTVSIAAGFSTLPPNFISYKILQLTSQNRRLYFGVACWTSVIALIGLIYATSYSWMIICATLGGVSMGSISSCQDLVLYDVLGLDIVRLVYTGLSTIVGLSILAFCFIHDITLCLHIAALLQFLGGLYWISSPALNLIKSIRYKFHMMSRASSDEA